MAPGYSLAVNSRPGSASIEQFRVAYRLLFR